jgi:hypothetical protein
MMRCGNLCERVEQQTTLSGRAFEQVFKQLVRGVEMA